MSITPEAVASAEQAMRDNGMPTHEVVAEDYFGFDETHIVKLPDGVSFVEHKTLSEGKRRKYLNGMNRDVVIQKATGDARMSMAPGDERYSLLKSAITGWNLKRRNNRGELEDVSFTPGNLEKFLESAPPRVIDLIDKEVRKVNAWLIEDMSVEDIDKEIKTLEELRETKLAQESGNASS
jgi:hypothetical protein